MGKAHHSPGKRQWQYFISDHAEERVRARIAHAGLQHRITTDVKDLLDAAISHRMKDLKTVERWWQRGEDGRPEEFYLIEVGEHIGVDEKLYALVFPMGKGKPVVKTVLTEEMTRNNSAVKWAKSAEEIARGDNSLKVGLDIPEEVKKAVATQKATKQEVKAISKKDVSPYCVVFNVPGNVEREVHFTFGATETKKAVKSIYEKYPNAMVSVWEPSETISFKAKVVVEFN